MGRGYFPGDARALEPEAIILELVHEGARHILIAEARSRAARPDRFEADTRLHRIARLGAHDLELASR